MGMFLGSSCLNWLTFKKLSLQGTILGRARELKEFFKECILRNPVSGFLSPSLILCTS